MEPSLFGLQENSVDKEAFARSILAHNADGCDLLFFGDGTQELLSLRIEYESLGLRVADEWHSQFGPSDLGRLHAVGYDLNYR